jgi:hypothetical protein
VAGAESEDLPELAEPGHWHPTGWVGAVLEAQRVTERSDAIVQPRTMSDYVDGAVSAMRGVVLG